VMLVTSPDIGRWARHGHDRRRLGIGRRGKMRVRSKSNQSDRKVYVGMTTPVLLLRDREHKIGLVLWPSWKKLRPLQKAHSFGGKMI